jgi:hypothetical protein
MKEEWYWPDGRRLTTKEVNALTKTQRIIGRVMSWFYSVTDFYIN